MTDYANNFLTCTKYNYKWPESIDVDLAGNLYFTDVAKKSFFRIRRKEDNTLDREEEMLLTGFKHAGGISIDRENNHLYLGVRIKEKKNVRAQIIQIPLAVFKICTDIPYTLENLQEECLGNDSGITLESRHIDKKPNGVVFDKKESTAYYTYQRGLFSGLLLGRKGHIGKIQFDSGKCSQIKIVTPNGIDIDPTAGQSTVVVSLFRQNSIGRMESSENKVHDRKTLRNKDGKVLGRGPDGLICLENGDVLVTAFWSHKILYLSWDGSSFRGPVTIADGLDNPTDLVLGISSDGVGESLFVTATVFWRGGLPRAYARGRVIEIIDIKDRIERAKQMLK